MLLSSMSNFLLTGQSWLGLTWFGDIDRRVANVLRVGDGDIPNGYRIEFGLFELLDPKVEA